MHKQAAKNTALLLATAVMSGLGIAVIINFIPATVLIYMAVAALFAFIVYCFYSIEKSRLESLERLNKTVDQ